MSNVTVGTNGVITAIDVGKAADLANAKSKNNNSDNSHVLTFMAGAREASKMVGDASANTEKGLTALTAYTVLAYQNDDYIKGKIDNYLATRNLKLTTKALRDLADTWFEKEFEISKPNKSAMQISKFKYLNRIRAHIQAFTRAKEYTKRGLVFIYKDKKVFVTKDSYAKVANDTAVTSDVEVVAKTSASSDKITFASLQPKAAKKESKAGTVVSVSAANFGMICNAAKTAAEVVTPEKMTGTDKLAALNAFFALQALLGAKEDRSMIKAYEDLTNDPARKTA